MNGYHEPHRHYRERSPFRRESREGCFGCLSFAIVVVVLLGCAFFLFPYFEPALVQVRDALREVPEELMPQFRLLVWVLFLGISVGVIVTLVRHIGRR